MNTENHEIPENSLCLLRFAAQTPCTKGNRAAMAALNGYALTLPWEGATPLVCIKQEVVYLTSAYVAQAPEPNTMGGLDAASSSASPPILLTCIRLFSFRPLQPPKINRTKSENKT